MNTIRWKYSLIVLLIILCLSTSLHAENIRGQIAGTGSADGTAVSFVPESLVIIDPGTIQDLQGGLELKLEIPQGLRRYQNSFALFVYRGITPPPNASERAYSGTRAYMRLLPSRDAMFVRIPFDDGHSIAGDALTDVLPIAVAPDEFPLLVTVLPVMKGIPDSAFSQQLKLTASSLWKDEGTLTVNISNLSGDPDEVIRITIDGIETQTDQPIEVSAGMHRVSVSSNLAPTVEKNVAVEPGEQAAVTIDLDYRLPELTITVPEGAVLLLDGTPLDIDQSPSYLQVEPGQHTVTYKFGGMEISRSFDILPGGKVSIDLILDIDIVEYGETGSPYGAGDG